jgi:hypothetical protein
MSRTVHTSVLAATGVALTVLAGWMQPLPRSRWDARFAPVPTGSGGWCTKPPSR